MLQTRKGKRTGEAAIKIAIEMSEKKLINHKDVINRIVSKNLDEIMHPKVDPELEKINYPKESGLPASPEEHVDKLSFLLLMQRNGTKKINPLFLLGMKHLQKMFKVCMFHKELLQLKEG